ncbi:protoporphyrinogen oxidase [Holotrichia oblita]|uniref:Protoporphyrinogen oxidase n=1 Tax=Holotrichia oblita TaxID=644536 RepID=A0ACB9SX56_HOLOL|nr:protoporphyrinogen oxidase [Holotrichia oblita]
MSKVVLGGGLSGLSAAYYAINKFPNQVITLLEKSDRLGGWLKSTRQDDGSIFEQSARTIRPSGEAGANTLQLLNELGLNHEIVPILKNSPAALNRMIYVNGKLHLLPNSLGSLFKKQEPFSNLFIDNDESLYSFVDRRFGTEIADYLISPMVCGICGGNAKEISVKFLMKSIFEKEQEYGSVTRGIIADFFNKKEKVTPVYTQLEQRANTEKWSVYSFKNGIETLPNALRKEVSSKGVKIDLNQDIQEIEVHKKSILVNKADGTVLLANHLISCIPALSLAPLLKKQHPYLSKMLSSFETASMCVVNLKYNKKLLQQEGFGFLVAPKENLPLLGVIYDSCCFPYEDSTILTAMLGGFKFNTYFNEKTTAEEVLSIVTKNLEKILNISDQPDNFKVSILNQCIPQYTVGHSKKIGLIEDYLRDNDLPLSLCGASYYGVGVNDVILSAKKAVDGL